jgi:purine-nucleoside/S-methyl-5'-thioadenosine phosphorylase / adenosine deaminase
MIEGDMPAHLESSILSALPWAIHGFGTRNSTADSESVSSLKQIHSNVVVLADQPGFLGEGDALITNHPGLAISIRTADCYPILLADTRNRAVAAIHAGWRGTASEIVVKAVEEMQAEFDTQPADILAAIGPGIGVCCYEVGRDVSNQFGFAGQTHLDLGAENRKQLESAGVPAPNIQALGVCTFCDAERFFSYRREKDKAGRMTSFIRIEPKN